MQKNTLAILAGAAAFVLSGCQTGGLAANQKAAIATGVGALAGGILGHQVNHKNGRYVGALAGAIAGAAIGSYMDRQQQQLQQQVAGSGVQVKRVNDSTIQLNIQSEVLFGIDQATVKPNFYQPLMAIAQTLKQYPNTIVHVYGFTDGSGTPQHNLVLSQERAQNVAQFLANQGVTGERFIIRGYGEQFATAANNPQDRRVSIFIKAIDQNNPQAAYTPIY